MKKLLLFLLYFTPLSLFAQDSLLFDETWYLISIGSDYSAQFSPYPNQLIINFEETNVATVTGVSNTLTGNVSISSNQINFETVDVTNIVCETYGCDFEDYYFYEVLSTPELTPKSFNYFIGDYNETTKQLTLVDEFGEEVIYRNTPIAPISEEIFQTWYLYETVGDLEPPMPVTSPTPPQVTINEDLTFTGTNGCVTFHGLLVFGDMNGWDGRYLQIIDLEKENSQCENGEQNTTGIQEFEISEVETLLSFYQLSDTHFDIESLPGFISSFRNFLLETPDNQLQQLSISPNPASNFIKIENSEDILNEVQILNLEGKVIATYTDNLSTIPCDSISNGIYFLKIMSDSAFTVKKFIKK